MIYHLLYDIVNCKYPHPMISHSQEEGAGSCTSCSHTAGGTGGGTGDGRDFGGEFQWSSAAPCSSRLIALADHRKRCSFSKVGEPLKYVLLGLLQQKVLTVMCFDVPSLPYPYLSKCCLDTQFLLKGFLPIQPRNCWLSIPMFGPCPCRGCCYPHVYCLYHLYSHVT